MADVPIVKVADGAVQVPSARRKFDVPPPEAATVPDKVELKLLMMAVNCVLVYSPSTPALSYKTRSDVPPVMADDPTANEAEADCQVASPRRNLAPSPIAGGGTKPTVPPPPVSPTNGAECRILVPVPTMPVCVTVPIATPGTAASEATLM